MSTLLIEIGKDYVNFISLRDRIRKFIGDFNHD